MKGNSQSNGQGKRVSIVNQDAWSLMPLVMSSKKSLVMRIEMNQGVSIGGVSG